MKRIAPLLLPLLAATALLAAGSDPLKSAKGGKKDRGTTTVTADKLEFDYEQYVALFEGHVKIVDPQFTLTSDKMLIFFENTNSVSRVDAVGHVHMTSLDRTASCAKAVYTRNNGAIVLTGDPVVTKGQNSLRGQKITVWLGDNRVDVEGGVQLQGTPEDK